MNAQKIIELMRKVRSSLTSCKLDDEIAAAFDALQAERDELRQQLEVARVDAEQLREAADALLSNEEHATSGGMRSYQKGSPTWELWEDLRAATKGTTE